MVGKKDQRSHETYYFYKHTHLHAVRHALRSSGACHPNLLCSSPTLFDLRADIGETTNVAPNHPEVVRKLMQYVEDARKDLGDRDIKGSGGR